MCTKIGRFPTVGETPRFDVSNISGGSAVALRRSARGTPHVRGVPRGGGWCSEDIERHRAMFAGGCRRQGSGRETCRRGGLGESLENLAIAVAQRLCLFPFSVVSLYMVFDARRRVSEDKRRPRSHDGSAAGVSYGRRDRTSIHRSSMPPVGSGLCRLEPRRWPRGLFRRP